MCLKKLKRKYKEKSTRTVRVENYETDNESDHEQETSRDSNKYSSRIKTATQIKFM